MRGSRVIYLFILFAVISCSAAFSQNVEKVYKPYIATAQLFVRGNQLSLPVIRLGSDDKLELHFDDLEGGYKNYYYSFVLCNYDWTPTTLNSLDYVKGFTVNRINTYRYSSRALTRYTHYAAELPEQNTVPIKSGNYLLKVFLDGDTSKLAFTKQMLVVDVKSAISAIVVQPFTPDRFYTHQRIKFTAGIDGINSFSGPQQIKAVVLQNNRWDNSQRDIQPTFTRNNVMEYNAEPIAVFPGGKEWRWANLTSLRLLSDRVADGKFEKNSTELFMKVDASRAAERYVYFRDYDGMYEIRTYETINPYWQGDYATVHFYYAPPGGKPFANEDIYLAGGFTHFDRTPRWKMSFNDSLGIYEVATFMKQGYYDYTYLITDKQGRELPAAVEGDYWETENTYTILLYYRGFADRYDQILGMSQINSISGKPGFSF